MSNTKPDLLSSWFHYNRLGEIKKVERACSSEQPELNNDLLNSNSKLLASLLYVDKINESIVFAQSLSNEEEWETLEKDLICQGVLEEDEQGRFGLSINAKQSMTGTIPPDLISEQTKSTFNIFINLSSEAADVLRTRQAILGRRFFLVEGQNLLNIIKKSLEFGWIDISLRVSLLVSYVVIQTGILQEHYEVLKLVRDAAKQIPEYEGDVLTLLTNLGRIYRRRGDLDNALIYFQETLARAKELDNYERVTRSLTNIGDIYADLNQFDRALEYHESRLTIHKVHQDFEGMLLAYRRMGQLYLKMNDLEKAGECFQNEYEVSRQKEDKRGIISSLQNIAALRTRQGKDIGALELYHRALDVAKEVGDLPTIARILSDIGQRYLRLRRLRDAEKSLIESVALAEKAGDYQTAAVGHRDLAEIYDRTANWDSAISSINRSLDFANKIGAQEIREISLRKLGELYLRKPDVDSAIVALRFAVDEATSRDAKRNSMVSLGRAHMIQKDFGAAEKILKEALALSEASTPQRDYPRILGLLGQIHVERREYGQAISILTEAVNKELLLGYPTKALYSLNRIAGIYSQLAEPELAITIYNRSIEIVEKKGDPKEVAYVYHKLADANAAANKFRDATMYYLQAHALFSKLRWEGKLKSIEKSLKLMKRQLGNAAYKEVEVRFHDRREHFHMLIEQAVTSEKMRDYGSASKHYLQAVNYLRSHKTEEDWHKKLDDTILLYAISLKNEQKWQDAIGKLQEVFEHYSSERNYSRMAKVYFEIGNIYHVMNSFENARLYYKDADRLYRRSLEESGRDGDEFGRARVKESLGLLEFYLGMLAEARRDLGLSRELYEALGRKEYVQRVERVLVLVNEYESKGREALLAQGG
jgi:tetratricopeptide (TPR) repeat protein